ncbi:CheR family methyltransferase [Falsiroseomonas sp. HW251]|uniref:CheR family methyltransferase n=1 Tax=Falsiroseomonas sp. HW251 TaxID=3390998 RepID=UPI003D320506
MNDEATRDGRAAASATTRAAPPLEPLLVAVGASAGGLAAAEALLAGLDGDLPLVIVIAQHLAPGDEPGFARVLAERAGLGVAVAEDGMALQPGTALVIPPDREVAFRVNRIRLRPLRRGAGVGDRRLNPVDRLFRAVATAFGARAVGIVLSGTGVDGAMGLQAIGEAGGLTMAQDPATASRRDMPDAAGASGFADLVAAPGALAAALAEHDRHRRDRVLAEGPPGGAAAQRSAVVGLLPEVCALLRERTGHDFRHYKASTLVRRVERRMRVLRLDNPRLYIERLGTDPQEPATLFRELLIGVTGFFRDSEAFAVLAERALDPLLATRSSSDPLRIWVAGCATGEEAYSVAMLVRERLDGMVAPPPVQIFATDVNERALATARRGIYPVSIAASVSPERLERFFTRRGRQLQVTEELRAMCLFSPHNIIADPPFSRLDLICCRNMLIYFGAHLQKKLIPVFHYALRPGGFLFLGTSETLTGHAELFRPVDPRHRLAQRSAGRGIAPPGSPGPRTVPRAAPELPLAPWQEPAGGLAPAPDADLGAIAHRILLDEFAPAYAIVTGEGSAVYLSEKAGRYLQPPSGSFTNAVTRMARRGLGVGLRAALSEAVRIRRAVVREGLQVQTERGAQPLRLTCQPMPELGRGEDLYMLVFEEAGPPRAQGAAGGIAPDAEAVIGQLERDLLHTREDLERAVQDLEAANEELKASNEELLSMNEELQSSNEELETSKDEVQSANGALAAANADLENLLRATRIATIFLDGEGRVRSFTPAATAIYPIAPGDIGRPLAHLTHGLKDLPPLPTAEALREAPDGVEHEAESEDGHWYLRRVLPYRAHDQAEEGLVVTFLDITRRKQDEQALARGAERFRRAQEAGQTGTFEWDAVADAAVWSDGIYRLLGLPPGSEANLGTFLSLVHPDDVAGLQGALAAAGATGRFDAEFRILRADTGEMRWIAARGDAGRDTEGRLLGIHGVNVDITALRRAEDERAAANARASLAMRAGDLVSWEVEAETGRLLGDAGLAELFGVPADELDGTMAPFVGRVHPEDRDAVLAAFEPARTAGGVYRAEFRVIRGDGETRWLLGAGQGIAGHNGSVRVIGYNTDVTERRRAEAALRDALAELQAIYDTAPVGLCVFDTELRFRRINARLAEINGVPAEAHLGRTAGEVVPALAGQAEAALRRVLGTGEPVLGLEITGETPAQPGVRRMWEENWLPLRDGAGRIIGVNIVAEEVTQRRAQEAQLRTLMRELDHRVKNTLAVVQSLAHQTQRATATEPARFWDDFAPRLRALARSHDMLTARSWAGAPLREVLERTLAAYVSTQEPARITFGGEDAMLAPGTVVGLSMVFHELATNAAKYGALAVPHGRLTVSWSMTGEDEASRRLLVDWVEFGRRGTGGAPVRRGFGTRLVDSVVMHDLGGEVRRTEKTGGFAYAFDIPFGTRNAAP